MRRPLPSHPVPGGSLGSGVHRSRCSLLAAPGGRFPCRILCRKDAGAQAGVPGPQGESRRPPAADSGGRWGEGGFAGNAGHGCRHLCKEFCGKVPLPWGNKRQPLRSGFRKRRGKPPGGRHSRFGGPGPGPRLAGFDAVVFYRDGRAAVVSQGQIGDLSAVENAAGGFHRVLRQGVPVPAGGPRHPRSAAGLSADGRTLYLLCVDGRRPGSAGATEAELGLLLKRLGAFDGLNFDGGGSSALALRFKDGKVRNVNIPVHGGIPGRERAVAICLGLALR
ncbi:MAG: phosphodiester glycosidase family protein [Treponema sp.]|nr:phosphodiester glycosidase family protein [Treponema sp.]